mgnify:CR=1 FL=1
MGSWRERAACRGMTELMYSDKHRKARMVCHNCPVQTECLASSIVEEDLDMPMWGMRAGMTASERFRYRRRIMQ